MADPLPLLLIKEGTTEKASQFTRQINPIYNRNMSVKKCILNITLSFKNKNFFKTTLLIRL
jgi:hypothetical protein